MKKDKKTKKKKKKEKKERNLTDCGYSSSKQFFFQVLVSQVASQYLVAVHFGIFLCPNLS